MQNLDSTVIATALPTMAKAFGADPVHMNVALTSYLLSLADYSELETLLAALRAQGTSIDELSLQEADLEQVFLRIMKRAA